jgi:hypothetical protein
VTLHADSSAVLRWLCGQSRGPEVEHLLASTDERVRDNARALGFVVVPA